MIPPKFDYQSPATLEDALALLSSNSDAKILSGGQSLIPMMRFRLATPQVVVDINGIEGLEYIREEDGWLKIGALTRESALDDSELVQQKYPLLADTARLIADPLVRNRATVGGNIAHAKAPKQHRKRKASM